MNPSPSDWSRMAEIMDAQFIGGILGKLYYKIGKQTTNFAVQYSKRTGEDVIWSKRRQFLDLDPDRDQWFIAQISHRQILQNEIILDFDRVIPKSTALQEKDIQLLIQALDMERDFRYAMFHTGSRGIHVHIFYDQLATLDRKQREEKRKQLMKLFDWFGTLDYQKASDSCMIALEFVPHWKTHEEKLTIHKKEVW